MLADRIEGKCIDAFCEVFERCAVRRGDTAAILFSIVSSCQRHGLDPFRYLRDLLANLPELPLGQLETFLPDRWAQTTPATT